MSSSSLLLSAAPAAVADVSFDGQRILALKPSDFSPEPEGFRYVWPIDLRRFLRGTTLLALREHDGGSLFVEGEVRFDESPGRTAVKDAAGHPLAVDKSGGISRMFATADAATVQELLDVANQLIEDVTAFGVAAFIGYGTLLGAARNGHLIGHDNDVDLIWFSRHTDPTAIVAESLAMQRFLGERGWEVDRARGSFIRIRLRGELAGNAYLDLFMAFHDGTRLYVDRFVWAEVPVDALVPVGTITLEGREMPAPRDPGRLLEAIYGPSYLVPDPTFRHRPPARLNRASAAWFGNYRWQRPEWRHWRITQPPQSEPSLLARRVAARLDGEAVIADVGCGSGVDSAWLGAQGHHVVAIDHVPGRPDALNQRGARAPEYRSFSFAHLRHSIAHGALLAGLPRSETLVVMAHDLLDVLGPETRQNFWLFARTALRGGGRLLLSLRDEPDAASSEPRQTQTPDIAAVLVEAEEHGARRVDEWRTPGRTNVELSWT